ncbi:MAG: hypothetical protein LBC75_08375 [Fibromonadaceae bacterium]|jgi:hypothetical protein|nr:hypothetical protein [Fibromonadaceae bacterium]
MVLRFFLLAVAFFLSCTEVERDNCYDEKSQNYNYCYSEVIGTGIKLYDVRDGRVYDAFDDREIQDGRTLWEIAYMTENLGHNANGSICYNNDETKCRANGRLYDWETAMTVCPSGWHLPSYEESEKIEFSFGGSIATGRGFSDGSFSDLSTSYWWTSTEKDANNAYFQYRNVGVNRSHGDLGDKNYNLLSVRCFRDQL